MYILTAIIETAQMTTRKIRNMLFLKNEYEQRVKVVLDSSYSFDFMMSYFIELLEKNGLAYRQIASSWLKKLKYAKAPKVLLRDNLPSK